MVGHKGCADLGQQVKLGDLGICAFVEPLTDEAEFVAVLEPGGGLFDGGLLDVGRQGGLAGVGVVPGRT